jgi:hypothetical protein
MLMQVSWRVKATGDGSADAARARQLILGTLDYCLSLRLRSGNFPSSDTADPSDHLVQWCHGAPGLALACIKAFEVYGEKKYLQAAEEAAEVIWERGLLKKGQMIHSQSDRASSPS